ncbi:Sir2 family NAD-dependent protein deacetylase [Halorussus gelatinilyticus]|uniref:Sir2 family NAD-dependent protein deacetylase n=1 Tax=Halorussus gelatinilyticus TaxID=2937524 RepID=A0A8U0INK6_9EURY|nr:Sir2 family NAD-dependent protein deacetylase [Halorussus gelatinilyticus]UPW02181.1 Sir2 family NAD-dependent protein deacetylase [Halorussus gelatinilyticus]
MAHPDTDRIDAAASDLRAADAALALTGAGVSAPSGVPPFRGEDGVWSEYDPDAFDVWRFRREPGAFWADWLDLRADLLDADVEPNPAHDALADLSAAGHLDALVTQNIDGLHQEAGAEETVELHGNARRATCRNCGWTTSADDARERAESGDLPPRCDVCDGALKPDAVLFGEQLPRGALARARDLAADSDAMVVAGSSLTVEPAASLPAEAAETGATLILVNLEETPLDSRADYVFRADVTEVLPALREAVGE